MNKQTKNRGATKPRHNNHNHDLHNVHLPKILRVNSNTNAHSHDQQAQIQLACQ